MENLFFKPTPLYKEFMILDLIEKNKNITQRDIGFNLGIAVSMVNNYLDVYEKRGYIKRNYLSTKTIEYFLSKKGLDRRKVLNVSYLNASQNLYNSAKENIEQFLKQIEANGFRNILLYGAGEVAEILLNAIKSSKAVAIKAIAIVDDDLEKLGNSLIDSVIISNKSINDYDHDGILISSYTNNELIYKKLIELKYPKNKIIQFFTL